MSLQEIKEAIDRLSPQEVRELWIYLAERESGSSAVYELSPEIRAQKLEAAFSQLRAGLSSDQIKAMTQAMNEEYIELWDEQSWKD